MTDPCDSDLVARVDPLVAELISAETRRQREKIILIPSESLTPEPVRAALASAFTSIYAEGYPRAAMRRLPPGRLADLDARLASNRRYSDWRFYKGTEMVDILESLAGRRAAECFATELHPADTIHANVQPLSGAAANLAIYEAFVEPGDTVMGLDLREGGHLTHGSEFHISGRRYRIVSYTSDPETGRLDYGQIEQLARQHRPKMIIAGFTSFPWQPDWARFRKIADEVGAILLADIAHVAGLVIGGCYPSPIDHAHVVSFTTHKTLCGPRGAIILSTDPEIASRIDSAVFPGEQGGPHANKFAAMAVALRAAQDEPFRELQLRIVENAAHLAAALQRNGLKLAYGGTDTHLMVIDLRPLDPGTGFPVMGEIAARILDLAGIVCNKNTIPGDRSAGDARGLRLGTPWVTQRGMGTEDMEALAKLIADLLHALRPFEYVGQGGRLSRGKLPREALRTAREGVRQLVAACDPGAMVDRRTPADRFASGAAILRVRDGRSEALLHEATTGDIEGLEIGEQLRTLMFDGDGELIAEPVVGRLGTQDFLLLLPRERARDAQEWLVGLADGYILFDSEDLFRKVQGPAVVEEIDVASVPEAGRAWLALAVPTPRRERSIAAIHAADPEMFDVVKPYFVGEGRLPSTTEAIDRDAFSWTKPSIKTRQTGLHEAHKALGARMIEFAGWRMPVWYASALEEHRAVRTGAGVFDLGHMGLFAVSGAHAAGFLNAVTSNYADWLAPGESQYAYLFGLDGTVVDDIWVYRRSADRFLVVVNAVNEDKDWAWLSALNEGRHPLDPSRPKRRPPRVVLRNLKAERGVVDLALQGPASRQVLERLLDPPAQARVQALRRTDFCEIDVGTRQLLVARTGYTGESQGFEIYATSEDTQWLWDALLDIGEAFGVRPCGLASRDSTRVEAGFPLYGHELAGPHNINPFEAGFASYVKLHKPFFVGRSACVAAYRARKREVIRFQVTGSGRRPVHEGAAVVDRAGGFLGRVTSCVGLGETQIGLALLERVGAAEPGTAITLLEPQRGDEAAKRAADLAPGDRVAIPVPAVTLPRFPEATPTTPQGE